MKKKFAVLSVLLLSLSAQTLTVRAGEVSVKNCTDSRLALYSFERKDKGCEHEVEELDLKAGTVGEILCEYGQSCQVGLDFIGGQWAYFKCADIEPKLIQDDEILVICSSKKKSNGFVIADRFKVIKKEDDQPDCLNICAK